jgi:hypothetical protein
MGTMNASNDAHEDGGHCRALAFVHDFAHVRSLFALLPESGGEQSFVLRHVPRPIVLHVANDVASRSPRLRCQHPTPLPASRGPATAVSARA